jgi:L-lactate utilization protein LutB
MQKLKEQRNEAARRIREINDRNDLAREERENLVKSYDDWMEVLEKTLQKADEAKEDNYEY